ncbi:MAG: MFS transporter [Spirochaetales bacterium]|nr:MFS transporter [Spirochaetales bacterium]
MKEDKVPLKKKLSYGCGDLFAGGSFLLIALMFLYFLTDVVGLEPALAGLIVLAGKIWDGITDPLMGTISDRTRSRFGRRRIYFLTGIIPVFISFSALWFSPRVDSQTFLFIYYLFAYILFSTVFTLVQVPYVALMPELTDSYSERASVAGIRLMFSAVSAIIAGVVPMIIIKMFSTVKTGYMFMGGAFGLFYAIPWIIVFLGTEERPRDDSYIRQGNHFSDLLSIFKNRAFRNHAGLFIFSQTAVDLLSALMLYYITSVLGKQEYYSAIMASLLIVPVITMPLYVKIARRFRKTTPMHIGLVIWALAMVCTVFLTEANWFFIFPIAALAGVGTSSSVFVPWTILPEVTDVDELISGRRREGIYGGMATFLRKLSGGIAIALLGFLLTLIGYIPAEQLARAGLTMQRPDTILWLRILVAVIPAIFILAALFFSIRYNVDEEKYIIMKEEIARRKGGGDPAKADGAVQKVCEELTGLTYGDSIRGLPSL